ncbi:MAG TPA: SDR family oxidoreductase [Acidimicrobiales bacterium]|nr:SDR family oxidoreductase [Acidimicrobiales bacterium]
MGVAVVTGASRGLGRALAEALADRGWSVVIDGREANALAQAAEGLRTHVQPGAELVAIGGDVADAGHRRALAEAVERLGSLDVLVNNASVLGPSPLPPLAEYPLDTLREVYEVNTVAPLALVQELLPMLRQAAHPVVLNITSDASVEAYEGWGGYGSSKAALDHLSAVLAAEQPTLTVYAADPGDMRTAMHQAAFPGEDISDRPPPEDSVPGLLDLALGGRPSGRYRVADLARATADEAVGGGAVA